METVEIRGLHVQGKKIHEKFSETPDNSLKNYLRKSDKISWKDIEDKPLKYQPEEHNHGVATKETDGFLSKEDKRFIDELRKFDFTSTGIAGPQGPKGEKGDPFTFKDFTPEQLEFLKVKGDKGEQGETGKEGPRGLRGPKGESVGKEIKELVEKHDAILLKIIEELGIRVD